MTMSAVPTSLHLVEQRALSRIVKAERRHEEIRPYLIALYEDLARHGAEQWWFHFQSGPVHPDAAPLAEAALDDQLKFVPYLNARYFGGAVHQFDHECSAAIRTAFHDRVRELRAGWSA